MQCLGFVCVGRAFNNCIHDLFGEKQVEVSRTVLLPLLLLPLLSVLREGAWNAAIAVLISCVSCEGPSMSV